MALKLFNHKEVFYDVTDKKERKEFAEYLYNKKVARLQNKKIAREGTKFKSWTDNFGVRRIRWAVWTVPLGVVTGTFICVLIHLFA